MNSSLIQSQQNANQNSITNKLGKFFKNLLELEKDQGRYDESVAIIQRYINKEISIDELGSQLKGNNSRAPLPESLMRSLKSNIEDLRREMFFGRVKIDRIQPPPQSAIEYTSSNNNTFVSVINARLTASQLLSQRQNNTVTKPITQIIRPPVQSNTIQTRPIISSTPGTPMAVNISSASLRPVVPSAQSIQNTSSNNNIRTVSISTSALVNTKPALTAKREDTKNCPVIVSDQIKSGDSQFANVALSTTILNQANFRTKINDLFKEQSLHVNISEDAFNYISDAVENFSVSLLEQAAAFACHRQEQFINDPMYKKIDDVRSQLRYLQEYDDYQRASEEERQKAELFKAAKSRSKIDNQEQQKLKETVRKIQEHDKNCDEYSRANMTALKAIGTKRKMFESTTEDVASNVHLTMRGGVGGGGGAVRALVTRHGGSGDGLGPPAKMGLGQQQGFLAGRTVRGVLSGATTVRQRNKRIILKDFQLVLDQDVKLRRFKTYKKMFLFGRY